MKRGRDKQRSLRRQATLALITMAMVIAVAQLGLRWFIDRRHPEFRDPPFEAKVRKLQERLGRHEQPWTAVMIGSSLTQHGFRGRTIEETLQPRSRRPVVAFNLGTFAVGPLTELIYLRRLLDHDIKPDLVLLEAFPMNHNAVHGHLDTGKFQPQILSRRDLRLIERYDAAPPDLRAAWVEVQLFPFFGHRLALQSGLTPLLVPVHDRLNFWPNMDECGCVPVSEVTAEERSRLLERPGKQCGPYLRDFRPGGAPGQAFIEALALLKQQGIPTAVVFLPEGDTMQALYPANAVADFRRYLEDTCRSYGAKVIDARDWLPGEEAFVDSYHLGPDGGRRFSRRLADEYLARMIR